MSRLKVKETELIDIGKKLGKPQTKDALVKLLVQCSTALADLEQSPPQTTHDAMKGCSEALVSSALLKHKDTEVGLLVAICISEIMRIVAPDAPYSDDTLKEIFRLIVSNFKGLDDVNSPSFRRRVSILETVAKVRSCVVMLDLECDDLILEMFETFLNTASNRQPQNVFVAMRDIMNLVLEESEKVPANMVEVILKNLLKTETEGLASRKLAMAVVDSSSDKLEPYVRSFLTSLTVEGKNLNNGLLKDQHEVIIVLYGCAPQLLSGVFPSIKAELVKDKINVRLKAVQLLGRLFVIPGRQFAKDYPAVVSELLKRFSDKAVEVRVAVVNSAKAYLEANPSGEQVTAIFAALKDRLLDHDDKVRIAVVKAFFDLAGSNLNSVPSELLRLAAERLRDKKVAVRKATLLKLLELYKSYCTMCVDGSVALDKQYEWIPGKILRCFNDKEIHGLETILTEQLFPVATSVEEQSRHWIFSFSTFDANETKALHLILVKKQRLQQEMQIYLDTRQKAKEEETPEFEKKLQSSFQVVASQFVDPQKAEENLQKLHQLKDAVVFTALSTLLDPHTSVDQATTVREDLLKKLGEEHELFDFVKSLATKSGYFFFSKEHVQAITKELLAYKDAEEKRHLVSSSLPLLVEIAIYCPELLADAEDDLLALLKEPDESTKEGVLHIMSKSGAYFRNKGSSTEERSNVNLILEQFCLEGNRKQAKYAVSAIAAMSGDSGLMALSVLYGRLVDKLEDSTHLPTVLQSLGCIAQNAMPIFETREDDIIKFVVRNVLRRTSPQEVPDFVPDGDIPSDNVLLKIYALKALVKSFLPKMNAHQRTRLPGLLKVLVKILACGEIADEMKTSDTDKAHLRLAAAKGVLRLARRWDSQIPIDVFHMVVMTVQDQAMHVRRALLRKIHHYLTDRSLNLKYATAYALCAVDTEKEVAQEARRFLTEFVDDYRKEANRAINGQAEKTTLPLHPEYALVYLVHVLAHHPNYPVVSGDVQPDPAAYEPFYRELVFFLRALIHQEPDGKNESGKKEDRDNVPLIFAILRTIKGCENAVDPTMTETLYAICDIAILATKDIAQKKTTGETYPGAIPLPASVYKVLEPKEADAQAPVSTAPVVKAVEPEAAADTKAPELEAADVKAPEPQAADSKASEPEPADSKALELEAADSKAPELEAAGEKAPEVGGAEEKAPELEAAQEKAPEPEAAQEKAPEPEAAKENAPEPEAAEEKAPVPEAAEVKASEPEAAEEKALEPEAAEEKAPELAAAEEKAPELAAAEEKVPELEAAEEKAAELEAVEEKAPEVEAAEEKVPEPEAANEKAPEPEAAESKVEEKAAEPNAVDVKILEPEVVQVKASETNAEAKFAELNAIDAEATVPKAAEPIEAEVKAPEPNVSESKAANSNESKAPEVIVLKAAEPIAAEVKAPEPNVAEYKAAELNESKAPEAGDSKAPELDEPMVEANESKAPESDEPTAEEIEIKAPESDETMAEANETEAPESDEPMTEANEVKLPVPEDTMVTEPIESKAAEPNGIRVTEPTVPDLKDLKVPDTNGTKVPELNDSVSEVPTSGAATPVGGGEKTGVIEVKKAVEEPLKVDGSHLPPCFTDKDVLAKFRLGASIKIDKLSSPRGRKRGKRIDNGETASDAPVDLEPSEPTPKKGKFDNDKPAKGAASTRAGVVIKGPTRVGRKSVDKIEPGKKAGNKPELDKEPDEEVEEITLAKRKRGRPKSFGKKDDGLSGDEMAGPSSDTTPTTSAKKGKSATSDQPISDSGKRKSGRSTKSKSEEDVQEKSTQKKEKVAAAVTPEKSAKKASAAEKSPNWKNEGERGGDETLVGCGIKVWWPLDKKFYKGKVMDFLSKTKKHKILYDDGEEEVLNLTKERWELTGKQGKTAAKETPTAAATPATLSGTKYPAPKRLKVTSKTPPSQKDESGKLSDTSKEVPSTKSAKPTSTTKLEKTPKASKSTSAKEPAASPFEFDEVDEPATKKQKTSSTGKGGKQGKAEKAMSTSKDSGTESAKEVSEDKSAKEKANGEDEEPLGNWNSRSSKKSSQSVPVSK